MATGFSEARSQLLRIPAAPVTVGSDEDRNRSEDDHEREENGEAPRGDLLALPPLPSPPAPVRRVERPVAVPLPVRGHQA